MLDYKTAVGRNISASMRTMALAIIFGVVTLGAIIAVIFQDNISRYQINPRIPYQIYTPPPPPAYAARGAWAVWPDDPTYGAADVFYVHSTTYASRRHWNGPVRDPQADRLLRTVAAPNEAGPFTQQGAIYGPRYRQATLFASFTHKFDGLAAHRLAYGDVEKAFQVFLDQRQSHRPFVLVGYGQGGLHSIGLLQNVIAPDEELRGQLAVAYVINQPMPLGLFDSSLQNIPPCKSPQDTGCVVAYIDLENGFEGSTADLYLEIKNGRGRVFLDTYPLTKLDTQMSTRFAKEIACSKTDYNCDKYDFVYTIKSGSVIIGGPSAGAAITLLTIASIEGLEDRKSVV